MLLDMFGGASTNKTAQKILPSIYYFPEFAMLDCNMYIILDEKKEQFCLIDTGNGQSLSGFLKGLETLGLTLKNLEKIFITHEHLDHILGLYSILNKSQEKKPEIYVSSFTQQILQQGDEEKICPRSLGISANRFGVKIVPIPKVNVLKEGESFSYGEYHFQVLETPGHSIGSLTLYEPTYKILFPGDVVFPQGSFGRYDFPGGNLATLTKSIERLAKLNVEILCSGHMNPVRSDASTQIKLSYRNISSMRW